MSESRYDELVANIETAKLGGELLHLHEQLNRLYQLTDAAKALLAERLRCRREATAARRGLTASSTYRTRPDAGSFRNA